MTPTFLLKMCGISLSLYIIVPIKSFDLESTLYRRGIQACHHSAPDNQSFRAHASLMIANIPVSNVS